MSKTKRKLDMARIKMRWLEEKKEQPSWGHSLKKTGVQLALGVGGGVLGYSIGPLALASPLAMLGLNHFGFAWGAPLMVGMFTGALKRTTALGGSGLRITGPDDKGFVERTKEYGNALLEATYLDKVVDMFSKKSTGTETTEGIGAVEEYNKALAQIEKDLIASAKEYRRQRGESTAGIDDDVQGVEEGEPDFSGM